MARKVAQITIDAEGRDKGKTFRITEMSASQAESWAIRALLALARNGVEVPDDIASAGLAGVAAMGLKAFGGLSYAEAEPLLREMFGCVQVMPDPSNQQVVRYLVEDDIEEAATRLRLRLEVFSLHTGFSLAGVGSASKPAPAVVNS